MASKLIGECQRVLSHIYSIALGTLLLSVLKIKLLLLSHSPDSDLSSNLFFTVKENGCWFILIKQHWVMLKLTLTQNTNLRNNFGS